MSEWLTQPLEDVLDFREGPGIMAADFKDSGTPLIRLAGLKRGAGILDGCNYLDPSKVSAKWSQFEVEEGDVLLSTSASLGEVATVGPRAVGSIPYTGIIRFRPRDERVEPPIIRHVLTAKAFRDQIEAMGVGSVMKHFGPSHLRRMVLTFPADKLEQLAIAGVLDVLDDKITAVERVRASAWSLARAEFQRSLSRVEVEDASIGDLSARGWLRFSDGYRTKSSEHGRPGLRIVRAGDVQQDRIMLTGQDFVSDNFASAIGVKASEPGDVVITTKGTVGRVAVVPRQLEKVVYSPQLCFFRVVDDGNLSPGFVSGWFRSADFEAQASVRMYKSDMAPYINLDDMRSLVLPMPTSLDDQRRIGEVQAALETAAHSADRESKVLAATRDELLNLLMSGKVHVKDAEKVVEEVL